MKLTRLATVTLGTAALLAAALTANATHSWNNYHWARNTSSFTLRVLDSTTSAGTYSNWPYLLSSSASQWSASSKLSLSVSPYYNSSTSRKRCSAVTGKVRVCNASYGNNGWLGLASINLDSQGHISLGTAKMNDSYASTFNSDHNEARHVMCQEVGHTFGLGHTSENGSSQGTCMDYSSSPSSTAPNQHDYDELALIYAHTDSYSSFRTSSSFSAKQKVMAGAVPMGVRVRKGVFDEMWVAADGKGGVWINHVFLAPGFEHTELLPRK